MHPVSNKRSKNLHEHLFSELQLYYPHTNNSQDGQKYSLIEEMEDLEICQETFNESQFHKVKKKLMPFLENVEKGMDEAREMRKDIGDFLDPENEQDRAECEEIGLEDNPEYAARDFEGLFEIDDPTPPTGFFKKVTLIPDNTFFPLIRQMDDAQRLVIDNVMKYIKLTLISRKKETPIYVPRLIVQGGAGSGKSSVIHVVVQLMEKLLR